MSSPEDVRNLYARGRVSDAWDLMTDGGWHAWRGAERLVAARVLQQQGAETQAALQIARAWAEDPEDPEVASYRLHGILGHRGVWAAEAFVRRQGPLLRAETLSPDRGSWACEVASVARAVRDFSAAAAALDGIPGPSGAWVLVNQGYLALARDDHAGAMAWGERALAEQPDYRPAVELLAHLHHVRADVTAALALLEPVEARTQWSALSDSLATAYDHAGRREEALAALERCWTRLRAPAPRSRRRFLARRSDLRYRLGDRAGAQADAEASGQPWHTALAQRIVAAPPQAKRVELTVPVVVQDHLTCAPATLAALARFHGVDADQRRVAEDICYDGTPDHRERRWGEEAGFAVREFTVTWDAAVRLLDRGLPFTLTTTAPESAHLQAVIGYDEVRGTLLLRDPGTPYWSEATAGLFEDQAPYGPRGMVLAPRSRAGELAALDLPDADLWDLHHARRLALARHDRAAAVAAVTALEAAAPGHRLALGARRELAFYDRDGRARSAVTPHLRALHPTCVSFILMELDDLAREGARQELLERLARARAETPHPLLDRALARELSRDGREAPRVRELVAGLIRTMPLNGTTWSLWAEVHRQAGDLEAVVRITRIESCLTITDGQAAHAHAQALLATGDAPAAEAWLRDRWQRLSAKAAEPLLTLVDHLESVDRDHEVFPLLEEAIAGARDPQIAGEWRLALAKRRAWMGAGDPQEPLAAARDHVAAGAWLAAAAIIAETQGDDLAALEHLRAHLAISPTDTDILRPLVRIRTRRDGPDAALAELRATTERFPRNLDLAELEAQTARLAGTQDYLATCLRLAERLDQPWFWRELAWAHLRQGEVGKAAEAHARAEAIVADGQAGRILAGELAARSQRVEEAQAAWFAALEQAPDSPAIINLLGQSCREIAQARQVLGRIDGILRRAATGGDGLWAWVHQADRWLGPDEILEVLDRAHAQRPDLWETWALCAQQHRHAGREDRAAALLRAGIARFPLLARLHLELGETLAGSDPAAAEDAYRTAVRRAPGWSLALRALAAHLSRQEPHPESLAILERARIRDSRNVAILGALADLRRASGDRPAAEALLAQACRLEPGYDFGWNQLRDLAPAAARALADRLAEESPQDLAVLLRAARERSSAADHDGALAACRVLLAREPDHEPARLLQATSLAALGDRTSALAGLRDPGPDGRPLPLDLRLCRAELLRQDGDLVGSRRILEQILAEDAGSFAARRDLIELHRAMGDHGLARRQADELCRRFPRSAIALGFRADLALGGPRESEALPDLLAAIAIDPRYAWATNQAFRIALQRRDLGEATRILGLRRRYHQSPWTLTQEVALALRRKTPDPDLQTLFRNLAATGDDNALLAAVEEMQEQRSLKETAVLLQGLVQEADSPPCLAHAWGRSLIGLSAKRALVHLRSLASRPDHWEEAVKGAIDAFGGQADGKAAEYLCRKLLDRPALPVGLWGQRGYAWMRNRRVRWVLRDLADWRSRPDARPWMLFNLVLALRESARFREAGEVCRAALAQDPDQSTGRHRIHLAWDLALAGRLAEAGIELQRAGRQEDTGADRCFRHLVQALQAMGVPESPGGPVASKPASAWALFAQAAEGNSLMATHPMVRPAVLATGWRLAARDRSWRRWWWLGMLGLAWPLTPAAR